MNCSSNKAERDGDDGYGRGRRREDREPSRSDQDGQWRSGGGGFNDRRGGGGYEDRRGGGGYDDRRRGGGGGGYESREPRRYADSDAAGAWRGGGGGGERFERSSQPVGDRPRLQLAPRSSSGTAAPPAPSQSSSRNPFGSARPVSTYQREEEAAAKHITPSSTTERRQEEAPSSDKWSSVFKRGGDDGGRRGGGDRYGSNSRDDRYGSRGYGNDRDRYGSSSRGGGYGNDRRGGDDRYGSNSRGGYEDSRRGFSPVGSRGNSVERVTDQMKSSSISPEEAAEREAQAAKEEAEAQAAAAKAKEEAEKAAAAKEAEEKAAAELKMKQEKERLEREEQGKVVADEIVKSEKRGKELTKFAATLYAAKCKPTGPIMLSAILYATESAKKTADWTSAEQYGDLLSNLIYPTDPKTHQLQTLYALQRFFHSISFPKGLLEKVFMALYQNDILDEDAFIAYKYDVDDETPGKMKAIIETTQWLTWLETAAEEEDEEEEEEDFNL